MDSSYRDSKLDAERLHLYDGGQPLRRGVLRTADSGKGPQGKSG
jgi:hypothetical protein